MKYKLSEIMDIIGGGTPKTTKEEYWNGTIPWLSVKDFNNGQRYVYATEKSITELGLANSATKLLQKDDIIISARGTVGKLAMIPFPMAFNQSCYGLRAKKVVIKPVFLYYLIKYHIESLKKNTHGSVFDTITRDTFSGIEVDIPTLEHQKQISEILGSLDDKIELNNKINKNLERQAQAIFRSWFLDYLPFNSIKPTNWKFCTLGETTKMSAGGDKPKSISNIKSTEYPYPIYSNGLDNEGLYGYTNEAKIFAESVTVSARGTIGFVCLRHIPYVPIVRLVALIPNESLISAKYLYLYLKQLHISGTGTTQQQLTVPDFRKTEILIPDKATMDKFTNVISPMFNEIWTNVEENIKLALLRDNLLPKLISGEINVENLNFEC